MDRAKLKRAASNASFWLLVAFLFACFLANITSTTDDDGDPCPPASQGIRC